MKTVELDEVAGNEARDRAEWKALLKAHGLDAMAARPVAGFTGRVMDAVRRDAALLVKDAEAPEKLLPTALELLKNPEQIARLEKNAASMALRDAARVICDEIYKLV